MNDQLEEKDSWAPPYIDPLAGTSATPFTAPAAQLETQPGLVAGETDTPIGAIDDDLKAVFELFLQERTGTGGEHAAVQTPPYAASAEEPVTIDQPVTRPDTAKPQPEAAVSGPSSAAPWLGGTAAPWASGPVPTDATQETAQEPPLDADPIRAAMNDVYQHAQRVGQTAPPPLHGAQPLGGVVPPPVYGSEPQSPVGTRGEAANNAAAIAAAMAAVFADISRTHSGALPGAGDSGTRHVGALGDMEQIFASIMAEATRQAPPTNQEHEDSVVEIISEVHEWDLGAQAQTGVQNDEGPIDAVSAEHADGIQAEADRVAAKIRTEGDQEQSIHRDVVIDAPFVSAGQPPEPAPSSPLEPEKQRAGGRIPRVGKQKERVKITKPGRKRRHPKTLRVAKEARGKGVNSRVDVSKRSLNLAIKVKTMASPSRAIPIFILVLICIAAFSYFAVFQLFQRVRAEEGKLNQLVITRDNLNAALIDFSEVQHEYILYGNSWLNEAEQAQADVRQVLTIVEQELFPNARVDSVTMSNNTLSVTMSGVTMDSTALIVKRLESLNQVESAFVYRAASVGDSLNSESGYLGGSEIVDGAGDVVTDSGLGQTPAGMDTSITMSIILRDVRTSIPTEEGGS